MDIRGSKRKRLSNACNQCRKRKVRCDEGQPSCRNCRERNEQCITTDPRMQDIVVIRRRANQKNNATPKIAHLSQAQELGLEPQQCPYDQEMIINMAAHQKRKFLGGGTLQALSKHLDRCFERRGLEPIGPKFVYGMHHAEEFPLPKLGNAHVLPALPSAPERNIYSEVFMERIHPLFPVLDIKTFKCKTEWLMSQDLANLPQDEIPQLACTYAVFALGADESAGYYTETGWIYLTAAYNLWAYIISIPYLVSVQALLLLSVALKARNKDGCGAQALAQAIRIANSLGLHQVRVEKKVHTPGEEQPISDNSLDARIWWVCYCLEQQHGLETGRPVAIRDELCNQVIPSSIRQRIDFFKLWVGLARIQSGLYEVLYVRPPEARNTSDLLRDIGRIDRELCDWAANVEPEEVRPSLDLLCSPKELHLATFLASSYFQTLITVHQAALLLGSKTYKAKVEQYCLNSPTQPRLRNSELILRNSARRIADLHIRLINQRTRSGIFMTTGIMTSMIILGFYIMKDVGEKRNRADLELLTVLSRHVETQYATSGQHPKFVEAITLLQRQIQHEVYSRDTSRDSEVVTPNRHPNTGMTDFTDPSLGSDSLNEWDYGATGQSEDWNGMFDDFTLADPWRWLQNDGNGMDLMDT